GQSPGMTPTEWAIVGIVLALAFLAVGLFAMWRLGAPKRRRFQRKAQVAAAPEPDQPPPESAASAQNGGRVRSVIELHDLEVSDVMVHRMNMRSINVEDPPDVIVGEIADEHDVDVQGVRPEADGSVVVDGSVAIRDLNRALGWSLPEDEATTIAGLVIHETQSIPEEKQAFTFHGKRFVILNR